MAFDFVSERLRLVRCLQADVAALLAAGFTAGDDWQSGTILHATDTDRFFSIGLSAGGARTLRSMSGDGGFGTCALAAVPEGAGSKTVDATVTVLDPLGQPVPDAMVELVGDVPAINTVSFAVVAGALVVNPAAAAVVSALGYTSAAGTLAVKSVASAAVAGNLYAFVGGRLVGSWAGNYP